MHFDALHLEQFRGVNNLSLVDLQNVNLLLGGNDAGKTSILEAISLFDRPNDIASILRTSQQRLRTRTLSRNEFFTPFETFIHLFPFSALGEKGISIGIDAGGTHYQIKITGEVVRVFRPPFRRYSGINQVQDDEEHEVSAFEGIVEFNGHVQEIEILEDVNYRVNNSSPAFSTSVYIGPGQHLIGTINRAVFSSKYWEQQTVELLSAIDPNIEGIKLVPSEYSSIGSNQVIEHHLYGEIPLYTYGDGMKKIVSLASVLPAAKDGILMIDEIETSLQASILSKVFEWLLDACRRYHIQLFVTTHSLEAIATLASCAMNYESELACYRIEKYENHSSVRRYSEQMLDSIVNGSGLDVR